MTHPAGSDDGLSVIAAAVSDPSSRAIAGAVEALVRDGVLISGQRLATVRRIADVLQVSPATVSVAWTDLRRAGWLHTDRRRGTVVTARYVNAIRPRSQYRLDEHLHRAVGHQDNYPAAEATNSRHRASQRGPNHAAGHPLPHMRGARCGLCIG
jgi:DNA-binding transcriptional regulator YhcF (GntR family)